MKTPKVTELMRKHSTGKWTFRFWIDYPIAPMTEKLEERFRCAKQADELNDLIWDHKSEIDDTNDGVVVAQLIASLLPGDSLVSAFEVLDSRGNGIVTYLEWP